MSASDPTVPSPGMPGLSFPGVGAGLAVIRDGKILLYRRKKPPEAGHWNILGGKVDHMESSAVAAMRETQEETGLAIPMVEFLCPCEQIFVEDGQHWVSLIYVASNFSGEPAMLEPDKFHDFGWFSPADLPEPLSRFVPVALVALRAKGYFARAAAS